MHLSRVLAQFWCTSLPQLAKCGVAVDMSSALQSEPTKGRIEEVHREKCTSAVTDAALLMDNKTLAVSLRNTNYLRLFSIEKNEVHGVQPASSRIFNVLHLKKKYWWVYPSEAFIRRRWGR